MSSVLDLLVIREIEVHGRALGLIGGAHEIDGGILGILGIIPGVFGKVQVTDGLSKGNLLILNDLLRRTMIVCPTLAVQLGTHFRHYPHRSSSVRSSLGVWRRWRLHVVTFSLSLQILHDHGPRV